MECSDDVRLAGKRLVVSWGRAEDGQLGHGDATEQHKPRIVAALQDANVTSISCGAEYTVANCAVQKELYSWGWGDFGRLGHGDALDVFIPRPVSALSGRRVESVACGDTHTLVLVEAGKLLAFGRGQNGQLGLGGREDSLVPQEVSTLSSAEVVGIACGAEHSLCVTATGKVFAWGWGRYGNLGSGGNHDLHVPTEMQGLGDVNIKTVACGWRHSMVVDDGGRLYSCGWSKYGQLGLGDTRDRTVLHEVTAMTTRSETGETSRCMVREAKGGWRHTVAATTDGQLFAFGWNKFGQLGLKHANDVYTPTLVPLPRETEGDAISMITCGWRHSVVVTSSGAVYVWGRGANGQLGLGINQDIFEPVKVASLSRGSIDAKAFEHFGDTEQMFVAASDRYALVPDSHVPQTDVAAATVPASVPNWDANSAEGKRPRLA